jgi:hypothetical protein
VDEPQPIEIQTSIRLEYQLEHHHDDNVVVMDHEGWESGVVEPGRGSSDYTCRACGTRVTLVVRAEPGAAADATGSVSQ